jgi:hypothetical protein
MCSSPLGFAVVLSSSAGETAQPSTCTLQQEKVTYDIMKGYKQIGRHLSQCFSLHMCGHHDREKQMISSWMGMITANYINFVKMICQSPFHQPSSLNIASIHIWNSQVALFLSVQPCIKDRTYLKVICRHPDCNSFCLTAGNQKGCHSMEYWGKVTC